MSCLRRIELSGITDSEEYVNACNQLCNVLLVLEVVWEGVRQRLYFIEVNVLSGG